MNLPPYIEFPIVKGSRVSIRNIVPTDIPDLLEICYYDAVMAQSVDEAAEMQTKINRDYSVSNSIHWGIEENATGKIVGTCGYYRGFKNDAGELGCVLLPQFRGKGLMSAAMSLAIEFGLEQMGLERIWAATTSENLEAIKLLKRLCFTKNNALQDGEIIFELKK